MKTSNLTVEYSDSPRLPLKPVGWEVVEAEILLERPKRNHGFRPYSSEELGNVDERIFKAVNQLMDSHPDDFILSASSLKPEAWRLLFYRGQFALESLTAFQFCAEQTLRQFSVGADEFLDPPLTWIGTGGCLKDISSELEFTLRENGEGPACAAWAVLCLAQRACLTQTEILQCTWWDPNWIKNFTKQVRLVS